MGAAGFVIVEAERSVARGARVERWGAIVREAAMLAGRLRVPSVEGPSTLAEVVAGAANLVMLVRGAGVALRDLSGDGPITLLVGPEGGWSEREMGLVDQKASLGPRNLRADTAAIVATAIAAGV